VIVAYIVEAGEKRWQTAVPAHAVGLKREIAMKSMLNTHEAQSRAAKAQSHPAAQYRIAIIVVVFVLFANMQSFGASPTLNDPYGVAVDSQGRVYVANLLGGVTVYNASLALVGTITAGISYPIGVAIGPDGHIYVANNSGNNVTIYTASRAPYTTINDPSLQHPIAVYVDGCRDTWVLDQAGTVHLYVDDKYQISATSVPGAFAFGAWDGYMTLWSIPDSNSPNGYATRIQSMGDAVSGGLNLSGTLVGATPSQPVGGVAQDALGRAFVTIPSTHEVQIWTLSGVETHAVTTGALPLGIAVDWINQRFYVAEPAANLVAVYSTIAPYKLIGNIH
jgi:DNA-binding beta-propeller fold protein YncE